MFWGFIDQMTEIYWQEPCFYTYLKEEISSNLDRTSQFYHEITK